MTHGHTHMIKRFQAVKTWKRGDQRAPHKPLLILLALGRLQRDEDRLVLFRDVEGPLGALLRRYGTSAGRQNPDHPFWYMRHDGLWEIPTEAALPRLKNRKRPVIGALREALGGFPEDIHSDLSADPSMIVQVAQTILDEHFPDTQHSHIINAVGLDLDISSGTKKKRKRDPRFAGLILNAYGYRCAVCGMAPTLDGLATGLEAAHVKWHCHGGPDEVDNGLCLCPLHHDALDIGSIGLGEDGRIIVSSRLHGDDTVEAFLGRFHGQSLNGPVHGAAPVHDRHREWHLKNVFKKPMRVLGNGVHAELKRDGSSPV